MFKYTFKFQGFYNVKLDAMMMMMMMMTMMMMMKRVYFQHTLRKIGIYERP